MWMRSRSYYCIFFCLFSHWCKILKKIKIDRFCCKFHLKQTICSFTKRSRKLPKIAAGHICQKRHGVWICACLHARFGWWIQSLLKLAFVCRLRGSLIRLRAITNPEAAAPSGESPLACTCFPSDRTAALGGRARCSALFELEYLQFSLPLHPSLFCQGSQTGTLMSEPAVPVSRYLLEGSYIMSQCRMPARVIIVMASKQKQTAAQGCI